MDYCQTTGQTLVWILDLLGLKFKRIYNSHFLNILRDMRANFIPKYEDYTKNQMVNEPQNALQYFDLDPGELPDGSETGITYVLQDIDRIKEIVADLLVA